MHAIVRILIIVILVIMFLMLLQSCSKDDPMPDAPVMSYNDMIEVLDNTGRSQKITFTKYVDYWWIVVFEKAKIRGKIAETTKDQFCTVFPDKCN